MRIDLRVAGVAALVLLLAAPMIVAPAQAQEYSSGKIPITTSSDEARQLFLQGRALAEKIRLTDAHAYYQEAVEEDHNFALAYQALANTAPSAKVFFGNLKIAVERAEHASEGEQLLILAQDAGVKGDPYTQRQRLVQLVETFPGDERAHNALGGFYFGRQEWDVAIEHYEHATEINPEFSPPYNNLGYAYRFLWDFEAAEAAFQKYIELIPDEPNPYDSYAELLMKMGRFEESIEIYEKALAQNPQFVPSYVGIGNNQIFMEQGTQARQTFQKLYDEVARTDGERRAALFWIAASYLHEGKRDAALEQLRARYAIAEENDDKATMSGDLNLMGNVLLNAGDAEEALPKFRKTVELMDAADTPDQVKENTRRNLLYNEARVALALNDLESARAKTAAYGDEVREHQIPFQLWQHHELLGLIAAQEEDFQAAAAHLEEANQQNPRVIFQTARVYLRAAEYDRAEELLKRAAYFNGLNFNYAYVRQEAQRILEQYSN